MPADRPSRAGATGTQARGRLQRSDDIALTALAGFDVTLEAASRVIVERHKVLECILNAAHPLVLGAVLF